MTSITAHTTPHRRIKKPPPKRKGTRTKKQRVNFLTFGEEARAERELPPEHLDLAALLLEAADAGVHVRRRRVPGLPDGLGGEVPQIQAQIGAHPDLQDVEHHRNGWIELNLHCPACWKGEGAARRMGTEGGGGR